MLDFEMPIRERSARKTLKNLASVKTRSFAPDPRAAIHDSQSSWYRIPTKLFVYWPKVALQLIWKDEAPLFDRVQKNGDFIRQLDKSEKLAADIGAIPHQHGLQDRPFRLRP
jgi:hypothetical protein